MKYKILVTDKLEKEAIDILNKYPEIEVVEKDTMSADDLAKEIVSYQGIIIRSATKMTKPIIDAGKNLKVICRAGVGVDNVDLAAATEKGIVVMNAPSGNTISTAELTFALMISLARKIPFAHQSMKSKVWDRKNFKGLELLGKTLGIVGLGRIGTEVAKRAKVFGMSILGYDPYLSDERAKELGIELADLATIYKKSDFITVHTPLTEQTKGMIGKAEIETMKKGVQMINCARGGIIDEAALAEALKSGRIAGAAVDVYSKEPPFECNNPLLDAPNLILLPHLGASTDEAQSNVAIESAESIANFVVKGIVMNSVNMPSISLELYDQLKKYIELSEKMGAMVSQVIEGQVEEIQIAFCGEIASKDITMLTRAALKGLFHPFMGETVNYVNAISISQSRGIKVIEQKDDFTADFTNVISFKVKSDKETIEVWGTVYAQKYIRVIKFNEFYFELNPAGILVTIQNDDTPGVVGKIGAIFGKHKINIGDMRLSRNKKTNVALTIIAVDSDLTDAVVAELQAMPEIKKLKVVKV